MKRVGGKVWGSGREDVGRASEEVYDAINPSSPSSPLPLSLFGGFTIQVVYPVSFFGGDFLFFFCYCISVLSVWVKGRRGGEGGGDYLLAVFSHMPFYYLLFLASLELSFPGFSSS